MPGCLYNRAWGTFWEWDNQIELGLVSNAATQNRSWWVKPMQVRKFRVECWDDRRVNQHSYKMMNIWRRPTVIWAKDAVTFLLFQRICPRQFALWLHRHGTMSRRTWVSSILSTCHVLAMPLVTTVGQLLILTCFRQLHLFFQTQQATWAASCTVQPASWKWHCRKPRCGSCKNGAFSKQISMKSGLMKIQNLTKSHRSDHQNHHADLLRLAWPDEFSSDAMLTPWPCAEVGHVSHVGRKLTDFGVFRGFFIKKATKKSELSGAVCTLATCAVARRCAWCCNEIRGRVGWLELTCRKGDMI